MLTYNTAVFSMLEKPVADFFTDGIIIKITVENTHVMKIVCKNICMITTCLVINIFFYTVSVTFIDKIDPSNPLEREQYWRHILQTNAPHGLNIADGV